MGVIYPTAPFIATYGRPDDRYHQPAYSLAEGRLIAARRRTEPGRVREAILRRALYFLQRDRRVRLAIAAVLVAAMLALAARSIYGSSFRAPTS